MSKSLALLFAASLLFGLIACDGGDDAPPISPLTGDWGGTYAVGQGGPSDTIVVEFDAAGNISKVVLGGVNDGFTAVVQPFGNDIYGFQGNDGTYGGFMTDGGKHAVFADEDFTFGVVQKGASGPAASYADGDLAGDWSGSYVVTDSTAEIVNGGPATANVTGLNFTATPDNVSGTLGTGDTAWGRWAGTFTSSAIAGTGTVELFLTADQRFAGSWGCETVGATPADCSFNFWRKQ